MLFLRMSTLGALQTIFKCGRKVIVTTIFFADDCFGILEGNFHIFPSTNFAVTLFERHVTLSLAPY
jgi:hypothetical protein